MKEICIINNGENINKIKYMYNDNTLKQSNNKIKGFNYVELKSGSDDIIVVKNYRPYFIYKMKDGETLLDIVAKGFNVDNGDNVVANDIVILSKPNSLRHVVKPLETLEKIASKYNILKVDIMTTNNLKTDKLFVGQILWI
ncbi:MAG: LysM peptidoglycan-binding domain-containing protein [Clostridiales bacterium]|nr:LysM peptidoglycan-binding domain-containing protein [Clostridiales bacterium]